MDAMRTSNAYCIALLPLLDRPSCLRAVIALLYTGKANSASSKTSELGFSFMKPCKLRGTHRQDSPSPFITSYHQKLAWSRGSAMHQPLLLPHLQPSSRAILRGPSFGSSRGSFNCGLRASASSGPDPFVQMAKDNLKRARESLDRKQIILDMANQALDSLLMRKPRPSPSEIAEAKRDVAEAELNVAKAKRDVAEAKRDVAEAERDVAGAERAERDVAEAKRDVDKAEWSLAKADLSYAQAKNAPDIEIEMKHQAESVLRAIVEGFTYASKPTSGQSEENMQSYIIMCVCTFERGHIHVSACNKHLENCESLSGYSFHKKK